MSERIRPHAADDIDMSLVATPSLPPQDTAAPPSPHGDGAGTDAPRGFRAHVDWAKVGAILGILLIVAAAFALRRLLAEVTWSDVLAALARVAIRDIAGAALATALSYAALIGYDALALRQVGARIGLGLVALTSFVSQAFTFTLGFGLLSGGAVRLRLYTSAGLSGADIVAVGVLCTLIFWLGLFGLAGAVLVAEPGVVSIVDGLPSATNVAIGAALLAAVAGYIAWTGSGRRSLSLGGWSVALPGWRPNLIALVLGTLDVAGAAAALWLLLPEAASGADPVSFAAFLAVFILATVMGVISHAPGGLGVFEAVMMLALPTLPPAELVASLVLFRVVYYVVPFALALALLGGRELLDRSAPLKGAARTAGRSALSLGRLVADLIPHASVITTFVGGSVLILSGATPANPDRLGLLRHVIPLPFVETSHLLASVVGIVLLVLATGLARRLRTAWRASVVLLGLGAVFSLAKGFDYEEATACLVGLAFLLLGRRAYYRKADLFSQPLSVHWLVLGAMVVVASVWLGFFAYENVDYANELWWQFAYRADAPRFLRATLAICITVIGLAVYASVHRLPARLPPPEPRALERVRATVEAAPRVEAHLALLGDKSFLFGDEEDGFVMYGAQGRSLVAMGDPVAQSEQAVSDLIWRFKELADAAGGTPVFYQVNRENLSLYVDAGFTLLKLGEEAWVDLDRFTLEGGEGRKLRQAKARAEKSGATFSIVPQGPDVEALLPELRRVSEAWLGEKGREKGFSLGFWDEEAMRRCDQAVIRHEGRVVAFANIWRSGGRHEFSVDLMRHLPDAPGGIMDLVFIALMARAKDEGFRWFCLGMGPLSGLSQHPLAPLWSRLGAALYRRGDRFYNFAGLRAYKDKFKPEWRPRYLAYPRLLALPEILIDVTALIARSPQRALAARVQTRPRRPLPPMMQQRGRPAA